jgi:hypothetical protein
MNFDVISKDCFAKERSALGKDLIPCPMKSSIWPGRVR